MVSLNDILRLLSSSESPLLLVVVALPRSDRLLPRFDLWVANKLVSSRCLKYYEIYHKLIIDLSHILLFLCVQKLKFASKIHVSYIHVM